MSGASPRGMSYNLRPNIKWVGEHWSDYTGYPQTVNKDQTMLSAVGFKLNVFSTLPVEITARELSDKPQQPPKSWTTSISVFRKAADQFCHYMCLLWYHCLLHSLFSGAFSRPCRYKSSQATHRARMFRHSRQAIIFSAIITNSITSITPPYIIRFYFIPPANPHYQPYWSCLIAQCFLPALMVIRRDGGFTWVLHSIYGSVST